MKSCILFFLSVILLSSSFPVSSQSKEDVKEANEKFENALQTFHKGDSKGALEILNECIELNPKEISYYYEMAFIYYSTGNYKRALKIGLSIKNHKKVHPEVFTLIGNCYDILGDWKKSLDIYAEGLKKFPDAGRLYFETAITYARLDNDSQAINNWELAVDASPNYASSYYYLAKFFYSSAEPVWSRIYGEIFMNLEPDTKRTKEISKLLYMNFERFLHFKGDTLQLVMSNIKNEKYKKASTFEFIHMLGTSKLGKKFSISFIDSVRANVAEAWNETNRNFFPIPIIILQNKLIENGLMEAYDYWLFKSGNETEFNKWFDNNSSKYRELVKWMNDNPLILDSANYFSRNKIKNDN
jgi:hypothetical protein